MSKAASPSSKLTRRKAIAATLAGVAAPAFAGPARLAPDPVLAAIAAHKAACARLDQACLHMISRLEEDIPEEQHQEIVRWGSGTRSSERMTIRAGLRRSQRSGRRSTPKRKWRGRWRTRNQPGSRARRPCCAVPGEFKAGSCTVTSCSPEDQPALAAYGPP